MSDFELPDTFDNYEVPVQEGNGANAFDNEPVAFFEDSEVNPEPVFAPVYVEPSGMDAMASIAETDALTYV